MAELLSKATLNEMQQVATEHREKLITVPADQLLELVRVYRLLIEPKISEGTLAAIKQW